MAGLCRSPVDDPVTRVAVFLDNQNIYQGARVAFGLQNSHFTEGQIDPLRLGQHLAALGVAVDNNRELVAVRIYRGEPSSKYSPTGQAACQRQVAAWAALDLVTPIVRPLKYYTDGTAREKGIDVLIALDIAEGATIDEYDVAILMSADSDLAPALERAMDHGKRVEVAAWRGPTSKSRLRVPGKSVWCHWLDGSTYQGVRDSTDFTARRDTQ
jgi:uncharacterized LabA/DUF88 family protein